MRIEESIDSVEIYFNKVDKVEAKTANTNIITWLYFKTFDSFILLHLSIFNIFDSFVFMHMKFNILYALCLFGIPLSLAINLFLKVLFETIVFENMYILSCWFHYTDILHIKFRFYETFTVTNFMSRILLIETLSNFRTVKYCFTLYLPIHVSCMC